VDSSKLFIDIIFYKEVQIATLIFRHAITGRPRVSKCNRQIVKRDKILDDNNDNHPGYPTPLHPSSTIPSNKNNGI